MAIEKDTIRVWDPFVRVFHWTLVFSYFIAWVSAEDFAALHEKTGYLILVLVGLRLVWGIIGSRYARFSDFVYRPKRVIEYIKSLITLHPRHFTGHNPLGGWMVLALLVSLILTGYTGYMMPLSGGESLWEEVHEAVASLSLFLVGLHVLGVVVSSLVHSENLVMAMLTGRKKRESGDV